MVPKQKYFLLNVLYLKKVPNPAILLNFKHVNNPTESIISCQIPEMHGTCVIITDYLCFFQTVIAGSGTKLALWSRGSLR